MAILRLSTTARNALANALATAINANGAAGTIKIYDGAQPATPQDAPTGSNHLLAILTFPNPPFGSAATGVITAGTIPQVNAALTGTAAWARIADAAGNALVDVDVAASGATINLNTVAIVSGGPVAITSGTITMPQ